MFYRGVLGEIEDKNMPLVITELNIPTAWGGTLTGVLLKYDAATMGRLAQTSTKIIGIHGWLDNLNSMLPLAKKLIDRHPNYEIYLYDQAGHGFSSHIPKGFEYSDAHNHQDLRTILQTLGWTKEKINIIGHSYGAILGMRYAASYPEEVGCYVGIDALMRGRVAAELFWKSIGARVDKRLHNLNRPPKVHKEELTFDKAVEAVKSTRTGIGDTAARLLTERLVRRDADNKLHFTRDGSLSVLALYPYTYDLARIAVISITAPVLFIGSSDAEWKKPHATIDLLQKHNPKFELTWLDGPHHLHMTRVDAVVDRIEQYFNKYLPPSLTSVIENSKL